MSLSSIAPGANSPLAARVTLGALVGLALAGGWLSLGRGQVPVRDSIPQPAAAAAVVEDAAPDPELAPDLALYHELVDAIRSGRGYYDAARERIPAHGFPISSPLNWRLPTYAWLFAALPGAGWIQLLLIGLSMSALALVFLSEVRSSPIAAGVVTLLQFGVVRWAIDGHAYIAQEPWAATLLLISLAAYRLAQPGNGNESQPSQSDMQKRRAWLTLAIATGLAALFFRELALPYCGVACLLAIYRRRWIEATAWMLGIAGFFGYFAWHVLQVKAQLAGTDPAAAAGLTQWLRFGVLDFVLLTTRMNAWLFAAPSWLLWLYLLAALVGLSRQRDDAARLACLSALAYLLAFTFLGRPENFYWGLLAAPLLPLGIAAAPQAIGELWAQADGIPDAQFSILAPRERTTLN